MGRRPSERIEEIRERIRQRREEMFDDNGLAARPSTRIDLLDLFDSLRDRVTRDPRPDREEETSLARRRRRRRVDDDDDDDVVGAAPGSEQFEILAE